MLIELKSRNSLLFKYGLSFKYGYVTSRARSNFGLHKSRLKVNVRMSHHGILTFHDKQFSHRCRCSSLLRDFDKRSIYITSVYSLFTVQGLESTSRDMQSAATIHRTCFPIAGLLGTTNHSIRRSRSAVPLELSTIRRSLLSMSEDRQSAALNISVA
jgi:hypothetical protein